MKGFLVFVLLVSFLACALAAKEAKHGHHNSKRGRPENITDDGNVPGKKLSKESRRRGGLGNELPVEILGEPGPLPGQGFNAGIGFTQKPSSGGGLFDGIGNLLNGVIGTAGNIASGVMNGAGSLFGSLG